MSQTIPGQVLQGLKQIGEETSKELLEQTGKIAESIITGKELLGDIKPMGDAELAKKKEEEEKKKQEEMAKLRSQMGQGRNVEKEMEEVYKQKEHQEEEEKKARQQELQRIQEQQAQQNNGMEMTSSNPSKQRKSRGSAFAGGRKKKSQPDMQQMSQTAEVKGKID